MRFITPLLMSIGIAATAASAGESSLSARVTQADGWVTYRVPIAANAGAPCCYDWREKRRAGCALDDGSWNIGNDDAPGALGDDALDVYLRVEHGKLVKARAYASSCVVEGAAGLRRLEGVDAAESVAMLAKAANASATDDMNAAESELAAMALHRDSSATQALVDLASASHPRRLREQSLFWLGQMRGAVGAAAVERAATSDPDAQLRANAVFALSQARGADDAYASIARIARDDASEHVRGQALFWMAQMNDSRAQNDIVAAIRAEHSGEVREQAVFALSQLKDDRAAAALIALVRGDYPRSVKERALFWLGQSGSPAALAFLDEVLSKGTGATSK